ncbi:hypothetical protein JCM18899A_32820 [Nocardioides sp. AN3]
MAELSEPQRRHHRGEDGGAEIHAVRPAAGAPRGEGARRRSRTRLRRVPCPGTHPPCPEIGDSEPHSTETKRSVTTMDARVIETGLDVSEDGIEAAWWPNTAVVKRAGTATSPFCGKSPGGPRVARMVAATQG